MDPIERNFWKFHEDNPDIYDRLKTLALQLKNAGRNRYGIGALFEVIRFHQNIQTTDPDYKLNNNYRALYARLLMEEFPQLSGFFATRTRIAAL
jgi:hypothetical protein